MAVETNFSVENQRCAKCGEEVPYDAPRDDKGYYCEKHSPNALFKLAATKGVWAP